MIVWGGSIPNGGAVNDGGLYNPAGNSWRVAATSGAPSLRFGHTAVWTGTEMIAWGGAYNGGYLHDGGRYNPSTDRWSPVSSLGAPTAGRWAHTAIWTGQRMIVWGGGNAVTALNDGGRYEPMSDTWSTVTLSGAPADRRSHTAVWTGTEMIIWGGDAMPVSPYYRGDGSRYNPSSDTWLGIANTEAPSPRRLHSAVWTGTEMIVWGGSSYGGADPTVGGRYSPASNVWTPISTNRAPSNRESHMAAWTGSEMIVWGGYDGSNNTVLSDGGRYNPTTDTWTPIPSSDGIIGRINSTAVWTGSSVIVCAGYGANGQYLNDACSFIPVQTLLMYQKR